MSFYEVKKSVVNMIPGRLVRVFAAPYVAGDSLEKALAVADRLFQEKGIMTTLDVLGEAEKTEAKVRGAVDAYLRALEAVKTRPYCTISIKPGHWGYYVSPDLCRRNIEEMAAACQAAGRGLTVDMEDTDVTDFTIALYRDLKPKYPILGTVIQSRLYRTPKDLDAFDGLNANIRMVIGIYNVPPPAAMTNKRDMKEALLQQSLTLLERGHYVCFATHDIDYLRRAWQALPRPRLWQGPLRVPDAPGCASRQDHQRTAGRRRDGEALHPLRQRLGRRHRLPSPAHARKPLHGRPRPQEPLPARKLRAGPRDPRRPSKWASEGLSKSGSEQEMGSRSWPRHRLPSLTLP